MQLAEIDAAISVDGTARRPATPPSALPLDVFALLQLERPEAFPNLREFLPTMPSGEIQESWNGAQGRELLRMSVDFLTRSSSSYSSAGTGKSLAQSHVLDFGCGWGRLLRLMTRYVPEDQLFGVDPWDQSLELCRSAP